MPEMKDLVPSIGIEHPDEFGIGPLGAEFLADDAVGRELLPDHGPHGGFGGAVGGRHRIEGAAAALVLDPERGAEERADRVPRDGREFVDEGPEIDRAHLAPLPGADLMIRPRHRVRRCRDKSAHG